jgi:uncharacterized integral membrane protein
MQKKVLFFTIVIALFFSVLFLDQNIAPVPVKFILGDPHLIGLSSVIVASVLFGVLLAVAILYAKKAIVKAVRKNPPPVE